MTSHDLKSANEEESKSPGRLTGLKLRTQSTLSDSAKSPDLIRQSVVSTRLESIKRGMESSKRYQQFVQDARKAREKSQNVVNKLIEHAIKTGDKEAVTTLKMKKGMRQILWVEQNNSIYQQNNIFKDFFENTKESSMIDPNAPMLVRRNTTNRRMTLADPRHVFGRVSNAKKSKEQTLTKDTLKPLVDIINESERANEVMDPKKALL